MSKLVFNGKKRHLNNCVVSLVVLEVVADVLGEAKVVEAGLVENELA